MQEYIMPRQGLHRYKVHQFLAAMHDGEHPPYAISGHRILLRSDRELPYPFIERSPPKLCERHFFSLNASCYVKTKGVRKYFRNGDIASRMNWLRTKAADHGFEVLHAEVIMGRSVVKRFPVDDTTFKGELRVTNAALFAETLERGVSGAGGRSFGFGFLVLDTNNFLMSA